jgi:sec-independent protein translocase protein TatA
MIGTIGLPQLLVVLAIIILIFGVGRISGLGRELGSSIKEFRRAVKDEDKEKQGEEAPSTAQITAPTQPPAPAAPPPAEPAVNVEPKAEPKEPVESGTKNGPNVF